MAVRAADQLCCCMCSVGSTGPAGRRRSLPAGRDQPGPAQASLAITAAQPRNAAAVASGNWSVANGPPFGDDRTGSGRSQERAPRTHLPPGSREPQVRIPSHPGSAPPVVTHACGRRWPHRTRCSGSGVGCTPSATAERRTRQYPAVRLAWRTEDASLPAGPRRWGLPHGPAACVISSSQISATTNARRRLRAPAALPGRLAQRSERDRDSLWERGSWPSPQPRGRCWGAVWLPSGGS